MLVSITPDRMPTRSRRIKQLTQFEQGIAAERERINNLIAYYHEKKLSSLLVNRASAAIEISELINK